MNNQAKKQILMTVAISIAIFMTNLDGSIVNIAIPSLAKIFNLNTSEVSRVVLSYLLALCSFLLVFGRLSDIFGARNIFIKGFALFSVASLFCGLSTGINMLTLWRFVQGVGGAMMMASFGAIVLQYLPEENRGKIFGFITVFGAIAYAIGAPVGGFLLKYLGWHYIFLINVPIGIIGIALCSKIFPADKPSIRPVFDKNIKEKKGTKFDYLGAILSFVAVLTLVLILNQGQDLGWHSPIICTMGAIFIISTLIFVISQLKSPSPLLALSLFSDYRLALGLFMSLAVSMTINGFSFIFPFYFEMVKKMQPESVGLVMMVFPITSTLVSPLSGYCADKFGSRLISSIAGGLLLIAVIIFKGFSTTSSWLLVIISFIVFGVSLAMFITSNTRLVLGRAPSGKEGVTSALNSASNTFGAVLGIALYELFFSQNLGGTQIESLASVGPNTIIKGFAGAAQIGVLMCAAAFVFAILVKEK